MSALKLSACIDSDEPFNHAEVSDMLRKQDEAIRQLREVLQSLTGMAEAFPDELHKDHQEVVAARAALAATENIAND
jgi:hypothetical protein